MERKGPLLRIAAWALVAAGTVVPGPNAVAEGEAGIGSPEGFSLSKDGLPDPATDAWLATVLVEAKWSIWPQNQSPIRRKKKGSGIILSRDDESHRAVVMTNAHTVTCANRACDLRVGFGNPSSPGKPRWANHARIVSFEADKDLAILEVKIPDGAVARPASLASPECPVAGRDSVIAIGWPDLRERTRWGVERPANYRDHVKRYSDGLFLMRLDGYRMRSEADRLLDRLQVVFHNADVLPGSSGGPLVDRFGRVLGLNTTVVGSERPSKDHRFCARHDLGEVGECVHVAIGSNELASEFEKVFRKRLAVHGCRSPFAGG